jgi:DHA2 family multidrug resistance protein
MYSGLTTVPMFPQTLLCYTAETSGVATAPPGIGSMVAMPLAGLLMAYMEARLLLAAGIACLAGSTFMLRNLTLDVSMASIAWPICLQGVGCSSLIVPLMTIAVGRLPQEKIGNGSGLFNLVRNLGGGIGISVATTYLARTTQAHQANLVSHLTPYDPIFQQRLSMITGMMSVYSAGPQAQMQAYGLLNGILMQQANLKAYVDTYYWTALAAALCLPMAWLLRKVVSKGGAALH